MSTASNDIYNNATREIFRCPKKQPNTIKLLPSIILTEVTKKQPTHAHSAQEHMSHAREQAEHASRAHSAEHGKKLQSDDCRRSNVPVSIRILFPATEFSARSESVPVREASSVAPARLFVRAGPEMGPGKPRC